ncbi:MAG: PhzF family phenazine biosynthesis protein, partial [Pseudomonadota bacterium]
ISVQAEETPDGMMATLASPPTRSRPLSDIELHDVMSLFGLNSEELDLRIPPAHIHAGANHAVLALSERSRLASMDYALDAGRTIMRKLDLVTVMLVYCRDSQVFDARNAFASGGVLEDPATGAAAAAFAGYLRDINWPHGGSFTIRQGEDMGCPSLIKVSLSDIKGTPVQVSGLTREIVQP